MARERAQRIKREEEGGGNYFAAPRPNLSFIPTGCKLLDLAMGGGWVEGRIGNVIGDKSTGKTLQMIEACANYAMIRPKGRILYREAESAFDEDYAQALGMPIERVEFNPSPMETIEDFFDDLNKVVDQARKSKEGALYVLDSLDALSDRAEMARDMDEGSYGTAKAKKMSELFRRSVRSLEEVKVTLLIVSQIRSKIGVTMPGAKTTTRTGGRALDFYASQVLMLSQIKTISRTVKGIKRPTGIKVKAKIEKNKVSLPYREAEYDITFGYGVESDQASIDWLKEVGTPWNSADDLDDVVTRRWYEIERSFLPTRRKYGA